MTDGMPRSYSRVGDELVFSAAGFGALTNTIDCAQVDTNREVSL